jgi:hypothetical protein
MGESGDGHEDGTTAHDGVVRMTFWDRPSYAQGYAKAAQRLFESAKTKGELLELSMPILFLVRHAVELVLKDLLVSWADNEDDREVIRFVSARARWGITRALREDIAATHDLRWLMEETKKRLGGVLPRRLSSWDCLVDIIENHEARSSERFRYDTVKKKEQKRKNVMVPSFDCGDPFSEDGATKTITFDLKSLLEYLANFVCDALGDPSKYQDNDTSVGALLYGEADWLHHELYRLGLLGSDVQEK